MTVIQIQEKYIQHSLKHFKQRGCFKVQAKKQLAKLGFGPITITQMMNDAEDMLELELLCKSYNDPSMMKGKR